MKQSMPSHCNHYLQKALSKYIYEGKSKTHKIWNFSKSLNKPTQILGVYSVFTKGLELKRNLLGERNFLIE